MPHPARTCAASQRNLAMPTAFRRYADNLCAVMMAGHTASVGPRVYIMEWRAQLTLGGTQHEVGPGACVQMPPVLPHAIRASTRLKMKLVLFSEAGGGR